mmetsp:Transcript_22102/g.69275  ORF Transcript_22102/g.69275 Transcript_22102/m.69275 type:complete len:365 (-) Transcript_22102:29-1123(-)
MLPPAPSGQPSAAAAAALLRRLLAVQEDHELAVGRRELLAALGVAVAVPTPAVRGKSVWAEVASLQSDDSEIEEAEGSPFPPEPLLAAPVALRARRLPWRRKAPLVLGASRGGAPRERYTVAVPRVLAWSELEDYDFWRQPGHFVLRGAIALAERAWLRRLEVRHGRDLSAISGDIEAATDASGLLPPEEHHRFWGVCDRLARAVGSYEGREQLLDCATVSRTAPRGHAPHVDNEMEVFVGGGESVWVPNNSGHRSWSASVMLSEPSEYEGGEFVFYRARDRKALATLKEPAGTMVAFRGDRHHCHGVHPVRGGCRRVLLLFFREGPPGPAAARFYHRDGTGRAVFANPKVVGPCPSPALEGVS